MDDDFQYGLVSRSIFVGLLWLTPLLGFTAPNWVLWHVCLLFFLGLGLKPLFIHTGLRRAWLTWRAHAQQRRHAADHTEASRRVERQRRDDKYRKSRKRDPGLPPGW